MVRAEGEDAPGVLAISMKFSCGAAVRRIERICGFRHQEELYLLVPVAVGLWMAEA